MKVLFIPSEVLHDYQSDTLHWGFRHLSIKGKLNVQKTFHNSKLLCSTYDPTWPHCTYYGKWQETFSAVDMNEINERIESKYYDLIVWMDALRDAPITRLDWIYHIYGNRLFIVDGDDAQDKPYMNRLKDYPNLKYFRRSLCYVIKYCHNYLYPIDFGFPDELISDKAFEKTKDISSIIPGDSSTYILPEPKYYAEYQKSKYAFTYSKCGWSCLRHLEIIFNRCIPIFLDLEFCPEYILHFYPKFLLRNVLLEHAIVNIESLKYHTIDQMGKNAYWIQTLKNGLVTVRNTQEYVETEQQLFEHSRKHLTCSSMVNYMLNYYD